MTFRESCHQERDIGHSWLCFLSQKLISIQEQDSTERILERGGVRGEDGGEATPGPLETKTDCIRMVWKLISFLKY